MLRPAQAKSLDSFEDKVQISRIKRICAPLKCLVARGFLSGFPCSPVHVSFEERQSNGTEHQRDGCCEGKFGLRVPCFTARIFPGSFSPSMCSFLCSPPLRFSTKSLSGPVSEAQAKVAGCEIEDTRKNGKQFVKLAVDVQSPGRFVEIKLRSPQWHRLQKHCQ